jgi:Cd2+/Zn2+-exporting ATPase
MGLATIWEAVFADMGTALIAVANSTRIIGKNDLMIPFKSFIVSSRSM